MRNVLRRLLLLGVATALAGAGANADVIVLSGDLTASQVVDGGVAPPPPPDSQPSQSIRRSQR
jgi:hypothetical protein